MLNIAVGDIVRLESSSYKALGFDVPLYEIVGKVLAFNENRICVSEMEGAWDTYPRADVVQIIKRTNLPQPPRLFRVTAEVAYLVKANSAEEAVALVETHPAQHIDFILVEPEDAEPLP